jgi:hypothetical protein
VLLKFFELNLFFTQAVIPPTKIDTSRWHRDTIVSENYFRATRRVCGFKRGFGTLENLEHFSRRNKFLNLSFHPKYIRFMWISHSDFAALQWEIRRRAARVGNILALVLSIVLPYSCSTSVGTSRYHLHTRAKYVYYARVLSTAVRVRILQLHAYHTRTRTAALQLFEYAYF